MIVTLDQMEMEICRLLAQRVADNNARPGVTDYRVGPDVVDDTLRGWMGELATAKYLNLCPDMTLRSRSGGWDLRTWKGERWWTIDVKTTRYRRGMLMAVENKAEEERRCDLYVHCAADIATGRVDVQGWHLGKELFRPERLADHGGHGAKSYAIQHHELLPFKER